MLIGELCKRTGLTKDTIRFYEKQGLITVEKKNEFNNYKDYTEETYNRLSIIKRVKGFGFTLSEVAEFLEMVDANTASCNSVSKKVTEKVDLIDQKIRELNEIKQLMENGVDTCLSCCPPQTTQENCLMLSNDDFLSKPSLRNSFKH
jgi:DNA-binding transcriptional MerR regulator